MLVYQAVSAGRSPACRFVPSCSDYTLEALERFGARKGFPLVARRLARCRPGGPFGLDPVPERPGGEGTDPDGPVQGGPVQDGPVQDDPVQDDPVQDDPVQDDRVQEDLVSRGRSRPEKRSA